MRFFLFFVIFFFASATNVEYFNLFYKLQRDKVYFSNIIRIKIDDIPYKNTIIVKKIDVARINIKKNPIKKYNQLSSNTDSKIKTLNSKETIIISSLFLKDNKDIELKQKNLSTFKNIKNFNEKKFSNLSNHKFKKNNIANNFVVMANDYREAVPSEEIPSEDIMSPKSKEDKEFLEKQNIIETINKAIKYNPKIKAQASAYESSKESVKQIYSSIFPSIEMNLSKGYKDTDSKTTTITTNEETKPQDFSINLEQNLYTGGKFTAEAKKAKDKLRIEEENLRLTQYAVILDTTLNYLNILEKKKLIELNNLKEEKFKKDFESIDLLVKTGNASQSDLVFAQSLLVQVAAEKIESINNFNVTKANYKKIVGESFPNIDLSEPQINNINFPNNFSDALNVALKKNPKMKIAELEENIAKYDIKSQFAEAMPNISIDAEYRSSDDLSSKGSTSETTEITANLKVPIFKGGKNLSKIKQAKITAKKVRYELENEKNEVIQTVTKSWSDFQSSETLLKAANINIEAKKLILEGIEQEAKLGMKSYIELLQSKEDLIDAEFNKIVATKNYIFSAFQLKADIGELSLKDLYI